MLFNNAHINRVYIRKFASAEIRDQILMKSLQRIFSSFFFQAFNSNQLEDYMKCRIEWFPSEERLINRAQKNLSELFNLADFSFRFHLIFSLFVSICRCAIQRHLDSYISFSTLRLLRKSLYFNYLTFAFRVPERDLLSMRKRSANN